MKLTRLPAILAALAVCGLGLSASTSNPPGTCRNGTGTGRWTTATPAQDGRLGGLLFEATANLPAFQFRATLVDVPTPCLSCIQGDLHGFLDDGVGPSPDFVVVGQYSGLFLSGQGQFEAQVFPANGTPAVGRIVGRFADLPSDNVAGRFQARWSVCP